MNGWLLVLVIILVVLGILYLAPCAAQSVNDDLFRALAWAAIGYVAVVDRWDRITARVHRVKTGLWWHDEMPEPDDLPVFGTGGVYHADDDDRFNRVLMPEFYLPDPPVAGRSSVP